MPNPPATPEDPRELRLGLVYGLAAYLWWGFAVIYFKAVAHVPPLEVLAHRIVWSVVLLGAWLTFKGRLGELRQVARQPRTLAVLGLTTLLIGANWLIFILAIFSGKVLQASLGYYINPLFNVLLGFVFLGERLRRVQWVCVALAALGVTYLAISLGRPPWIALLLVSSFGVYGLLRKTVAAGPLLGLTVETALLLPISVGYLVFLAMRGEMVFGGTWHDSWLLALGGAVTALPLLWFANAVRRLRLATVGFLQYISPTCQLLLAVLVYGEPFTRAHGVTFACIWTALVIYSIETVVFARRERVSK